EFPWTSELETFLLQSRQRMDSFDDEADRFATILLNNVHAAATRFGRDFAHAVLVAVIADRPRYPLSTWLLRAGTPKPSRSSHHLYDCALALGDAIDQLHELAEVVLRYKPEEAEALMTKALEITLDETFHISGADLLFPTHH
ncbi:MAG TPA: hypothetical protein VFK02_00860, partial [Kofleriaceae bacterium]|nr:hypothetical protein [Kofleriaceae bacterium]